ncbi:metallopeptidase TldD-related protein [Micromonospora sp. NPDC050200]|uniref:metallopeptidase TldD-related protein n=1 Tax=Micromonospora sp. NPDC050200 TaxID=3155664 RepID=UPI0033EF42F0
MTVDQSQVRTALDLLGPGARLDVSGERTGLLRYARSLITAQHGERRLRVRVRLERAGRVALGTLETLDPVAIVALRSRLNDALATLPLGPPLDGAAGSGDAGAAHSVAAADSAAPVAASAATLGADAADRYRWFDVVRAGLGPGVRLGGSIRHEVVDRVVADAGGLFRAETLTKASLQAVADTGDRSASVRLLHRDAGAISVTGVADRLRADLAPLPTREAFRGPCRLLLRPQAVITLLATYGYVTLGAAGYAEGRTAVAGRIGQPVTSELLTLTDDGTDPAGLPSGFDPEGTLRRRTPLIDRGVLVGVVSDRARAAVTGGRSTGHAVPAGWRFGADPSPSHLLVAPGTASEAEMLAACGPGLLVSRLDYLRVLHPKDTLVTGTTRDATYWVDSGRRIAWHPPVRLTFRMDEVLHAVLAVGRERERGEAVFMESVVAPALLIDAGPVLL